MQRTAEASTFKLAKASGVLGIVILWTAVIYGMHRVGLGFIDPRPLSYLGVNHRSQIAFNSGFLSSAVLFIVFGLVIRKRFESRKGFLFYLLFGQLCQVVAALAIDSGPSKSLHTISAFCIVFTLPLLMWAFARSLPKSHFKKVCYQFVYLELVTFVVGIGIFTLTKGVAPLGEALPAVSFHAWIVYLTYRLYVPLKPRSEGRANSANGYVR